MFPLTKTVLSYNLIVNLNKYRLTIKKEGNCLSHQLNVQTMIMIALFAAIISVLSQFAIPMPFGVPITGQTLAIGLAATILGARYSTIATILYIFLGIAGVPVFAQMQAGIGVVFGPTGGFLISFIPTAYITGKYLEKTNFTWPHALIANFIGMFITLILGTLWLKWIASLSWTASFMAGFIPFIPGGILKAVIASFLGITVRHRLMNAHLLPLQYDP